MKDWDVLVAIVVGILWAALRAWMDSKAKYNLYLSKDGNDG